MASIKFFLWGANFVVDLYDSHENFTCGNYRYVQLYTRGMAFSVLASNNHYCHPADGFFATILSHAICPNFFAEVV